MNPTPSAALAIVLLASCDASFGSDEPNLGPGEGHGEGEGEGGEGEGDGGEQEGGEGAEGEGEGEGGEGEGEGEGEGGEGEGGEGEIASGVPLADPADPRRFVRDGAPWFMVGYYPAVAAFSSGPAEAVEAERVLDRMAANGINYARNVFTMGQPWSDMRVPYARPGPELAADGLPRFDLDTFDESLFEHWRALAEHARDLGIVLQVCLLDGWHGHDLVAEANDDPTFVWGLVNDFYYQGNNVNGVEVTSSDEWYERDTPVWDRHVALVLHVVETLGDLPNIVWEIGNETGRTDWEIALADRITEHEQDLGLPVHLVMPRDLPGHQYVPWEGANCERDPSALRDGLVGVHQEGRIQILDNDCVDDEPLETKRRRAWVALTAGAHIDYFHFLFESHERFDDPGVDDGMRQVSATRRFVEGLGVDLVGMSPCDGSVTAGWCYGRAGDEWIVFLPGGGETTIEGADGAAGTWFDAVTEEVRDAGAGPTFTAPSDGDWALHVRF